MRNRLIYFVLAINGVMLVSCNTPGKVTSNSPEIITVQSKDLIPEGIAVNPASGDIYLSSLHQNKIVVVDRQGHCKDIISPNQNGFMRGLGIKITRDGKTLWACSATLDSVKSSSGLFMIDLASATVIKALFHKTNSSSLFNDLAIHSTGDIYLTDTYQNAVFRYNAALDTLERWLQNDQLSFANGIAFSPDEKILFVASGNNGVQRVDMQTRQITSVTKGRRTDHAIDGLLYTDRSLIGVIGWPQNATATHRIIRYRLSNDYYMVSVDTLAINKAYLVAPTTAALHKNLLYFLGKTNLGIYNQGGQSLEKVRDSLEFPLVGQIDIRGKPKQ